MAVQQVSLERGRQEESGEDGHTAAPAAEAGRGVDEIRLEAMLALTRMTEHSPLEITDFALQSGVEITGSTIGYLAFVSEDESVLTMNSWSGGALAECGIRHKTLVYPLKETGLWGEPLRQRRPVMTNDYEAPNPLERGLPAGHVPLLRHLGVPVFQGERIVALAGVGNKPREYTAADARRLALLMQEMWSLLLRKRDQERLRESEDLYRTAFENSMIGFAMLKDGVVRECNEQSCRILRCRREDILGHCPFDFSPPEQPGGRSSRTESRQRIQTALAGEPQHFYWQHRRWDGALADTVISLKAIAGGDGKMVMAAIKDITELRQAEEDRRSLELRMQHAQKMESLGVLASGIAHDFNNVLMTILGNADLAMMQLSAVSPARPMLREIEQASRRAADLCRQMLVYSGKGTVVANPVALSRTVLEMRYMLEVSVSKKVVLQYNLAEDLPPVEADISQLRQLIVNLTSNASEAIGEGNGTILISTGVMACDEQYLNDTLLGDGLPPGRYVYLEVSDTGCGMDAETRRKIFDPAYPIRHGGRGLGLAAVRGIVRGHKGTIKIYSEPGQGTSVKVLLPALAAAPPQAEAEPPAPELRFDGRVALLVDDEDCIRSVCARLLEILGLQVMSACGGREAVALYRAHHEAIDCVILDLTMPHLDGEETYRELRTINPDARVIIASGYAEGDVTLRFLGKGLAGFIQKPFQVANLAATLRQALAE